MVVLQNDASTAKDRATSLANGVQSLANVGAITTDSQTKLSGNDKAKEVIASTQELSRQIASVLTSMSQNIHTVSNNFQAVDAQLGSQLKSTGFSLNGSK